MFVETNVLHSQPLDSVPQVSDDIQSSFFPALDAAVQVHITASLSAYPSRNGAGFCESMKACGSCSRYMKQWLAQGVGGGNDAVATDPGYAHLPSANKSHGFSKECYTYFLFFFTTWSLLGPALI